MPDKQIQELDKYSTLDLLDEAVIQRTDGSYVRSELAAILGLGGYGSALDGDVAAGATTISTFHVPDGATANSIWVVIGRLTTECEVRKVTAISENASNGYDLTVAALDYSHDDGDRLHFIDRPVVNVKWFGAKGDGSTDDTTALQRAIAQVPTGSILYFPIGHYPHDGTLTIDQSITIQGEGRSFAWTAFPGQSGFPANYDLCVIENTATDGTHQFTVTSDFDATGDTFNLRDITLMGNSSSGDCVNATAAVQVKGWYWENVSIVGHGGDGADLTATYCFGNTFSEVYFIRNGASGFVCTATSTSQLRFVSCYFMVNTDYGCDIGGVKHSFINCTFANCDYGLRPGYGTVITAANFESNTTADVIVTRQFQSLVFLGGVMDQLTFDSGISAVCRGGFAIGLTINTAITNDSNQIEGFCIFPESHLTTRVPTVNGTEANRISYWHMWNQPRMGGYVVQQDQYLTFTENNLTLPRSRMRYNSSSDQFEFEVQSSSGSSRRRFTIPRGDDDQIQWDQTWSRHDRFRILERTSAPSSPQNGEIHYADGTSWNPGSGEGFYGRENGAWVKL